MQCRYIVCCTDQLSKTKVETEVLFFYCEVRYEKCLLPFGRHFIFRTDLKASWRGCQPVTRNAWTPLLFFHLIFLILRRSPKMFPCQLMNSEDRPSKHPQLMIKGAHINVSMHYITKIQTDKQFALEIIFAIRLVLD